MKQFIVIIMILMMTSCMSYEVFVPVKNKSYIPNGTQYILLEWDINIVKKAFIEKGILLKSMEGGFITEEILLDEGTRAMYKVHELGKYKIRISAYYGITQKVKSQMVTWAGASAASAYDTESWNKVVYDYNKKKPKRVFDYVVEIIELKGLDYKLK